MSRARYRLTCRKNEDWAGIHHLRGTLHAISRDNAMNTQSTIRRRRGLLAGVGFAAFIFSCAPAWAQVAPNLGTTAPFAVLGTNAIPTIGTVTCTDTGPGIGIFGQVGTTFAGGITNTGCTITGPIVAPVAAGVVADFNAAFAAIDAQNPICTGPIPIVSAVLPPG